MSRSGGEIPISISFSVNSERFSIPSRTVVKQVPHTPEVQPKGTPKKSSNVFSQLKGKF